MPTLYSAQVPAGYNTAHTGKVSWEQAATKATKAVSWLPYIVSGPLSDGYRVVGTIGALVHVLFWVMSLVMDGLLVSRGDSAAGWSPDTGLNFSIFSLVFTLVGFLTLLVIVITHVATSGIKDGGIPPFLLTLVTGSVKITIGLMLILLIHVPSAGGYDATGAADATHAWHEQRWILILSFLAKVYVSEALASNIQYSGSYEQ